MSGELLEGLLKLPSREQQLPTGEVLFRADDPVRSMFCILSGEVRLTRSLPHGLQLTLQRAGPGAVLAEASLFAANYHCEAIACQPTIAKVISRRRIEVALAGDAGFARAFMRHLANEVQRTRAIAETLSLKTVAERLDAWIAVNGGVLPPKGRWRQVASEIGSTPEALYRELARCRLRNLNN